MWTVFYSDENTLPDLFMNYYYFVFGGGFDFPILDHKTRNP